LPGTPGLALALPVDGLVAAFLIGLLIVRLLGSAASGPTGRPSLHVIDVAAIPLFLAFAVIVFARITEILPLG
ncbi:MAG: hypothetical protein MUQ32_00715, partial [Chloroflexi bacterium]|nr:hypothetical protein [Chloroflexota bacterium]